MTSRIGGLLLLLAALLLLVGDGKPVVDPTPVVTPAPFATDSLSVLIVHEGDDRDDASKELPLILNGRGPGTVREFVEKASGKFRVIDKDNPPDRDAQWVKDAWAVKRDSLPWIVASDGKTGFSQPLPATAAETLHLLMGVKP